MSDTINGSQSGEFCSLLRQKHFVVLNKNSVMSVTLYYFRDIHFP